VARCPVAGARPAASHRARGCAFAPDRL